MSFRTNSGNWKYIGRNEAGLHLSGLKLSMHAEQPMAVSMYLRMVGFVLLGAGVVVVIRTNNGPSGVNKPAVQEESAVPDMSIEEAHKALTDSLMSEAGIAGTGISECDGTPCLKVYVVTGTKEILDRIPKTFGGYEVRVQESGEIEARE